MVQIKDKDTDKTKKNLDSLTTKMQILKRRKKEKVKKQIFCTKSLFIRTTWHLNNGWDVIGVAFCIIVMFPNGFSTPLFLDSFDKLLKTPLYMNWSSSKCFRFLSSFFLFLTKMSKANQKKVLYHFWKRNTPPPLLKNYKTGAEKLLFVFK